MTMTKFSRINKQREEITMRVLEDMPKTQQSVNDIYEAICPSKSSSDISRPLSLYRIEVALNPIRLASGLHSITPSTPRDHCGAPV